MMPIRLFIREIKMRFSSKIQCCARLIKHYSTGYNKVGNMDNKLQYVQARIFLAQKHYFCLATYLDSCLI